MEVSEDLNITLRVGQSLLSITIRREDEEAYRAAAAAERCTWAT